MRIGRTLPPAATPVPFSSLLYGFSGWFREASETKRFEGELKAYHQTEHVYLVSSGKASLYLILKALHALQPGRDEVVIPAYSCYSVPSAIIRAGLRIRLCDVNPDTLDYDYNELEEIVKSDKAGKTLSIISIHLFGVPSDVSRIRRLVDGSDIKVVEDAAQSMGGEVNGQCLGTLGDVGFFSLGRGKALSSVVGGVVITANYEIAMAMENEYIRFQKYSGMEIVSLVFQAVFLSLFISPGLFWIPKSLPFLKLGETHFDREFPLKRMSGFQAGLAKGWQQRLKWLSSIRTLNSKEWNEILKGFNGLHRLKVMDDSISLLRFPLLVKKTDRRHWILKEGARRGLGVMPGYPDSLDRLDELISHAVRGSCPKAHAMAHQMITLPVHSYVNSSDRRNICQLLGRDRIKSQ